MSGSNTCSGISPSNANFTPGGTTGNVEIPNGNAPKQDLINGIDTAVGTLGPGWKARITPHGGQDERASGTQNHPNGDAADIQLFYNGKLTTPLTNANEYQRVARAFTAYNSSRGIAVGLGGYDSFMHLDQSGWRQGIGQKAFPWGSSGSRDTAPGWLASGAVQGIADAESGFAPTIDPTLISDGTSGTPSSPGDPERPIDERAKTANTNCTPPGGTGAGGGGGCSPVGAGVLGAFASLAGAAGLAIPPAFTTAVNLINGGTAGLVSEGLNLVTGGLAGGIGSIVSSTVGRDVLNTIAPGIGQAVAALGHGSPISGLLGSISPAISQALGVNIPFIGQAVSGVANQILGHIPSFTAAFNLAQGAAGAAIGLGRAVDQSVNKLFGTSAVNLVLNAAAISAGTSTTLLGGYHNMDIREMGGSKVKTLIGPLSETLPVLVNDEPMAPFASIHRNYNAMITQGFGSITNDLNALGSDLSELGYLADMTDLFRIGTAGQICSQIIMVGVGYETGVLQAIHQIGLTVRDINTFESDDIAYDILSAITDEAAIDSALIALEINREYRLSNLGELCDPAILFPRSAESNEFLDLNEIAPQLAMCGIGNVQSLAELGRLFVSMETLYDATELNALELPTSLEELDSIQGKLSPVSGYSGNGDLTVADFLGTAAGYTHTKTLTEITTKQESLWDSTVTDDLKDLLVLLQDTLDGAYTSVSDIIVPSTGGYAFGTYYYLDDAVTDINDAIVTEMDVVDTNSTDDDAIALYDIQNYHNESVGQLYKEQYLRQQYGIAIGTDNKSVENFNGDGSTLVFTVVGSFQSATTVDVYIDGVYQFKSEFTVSTTANAVTFGTAPGSGSLIEIIYDNGNIRLTASTSDLWNFATALEDHGKKTGFGRESDFINRIVTDDYHGQRIKAVMIQSRNKDRAESLGIACTGENRLLSEFSNTRPNGLQPFPERTGIWSGDPGRAADIYLQLQDPEAITRDAYYERRLQRMRSLLLDNKERSLRDILDSLMFVADDAIVLTDVGVLAYDTVDPILGIYNLNLFTVEPNKEGFVLGPAVELITAFLEEEKLHDMQTEYNTYPSDATKAYLTQIGIDIKKLVAVLQMTMISEIANTFGLRMGDTKDIFGMPSVSRTILANLSKVD